MGQPSRAANNEGFNPLFPLFLPVWMAKNRANFAKFPGTGKNTGTFQQKVRAPAILLGNSRFFRK
jgi:hypothetical protein